MPLLTTRRSRASKQLRAALKQRRPHRQRPNPDTPLAIAPVAIVGAAVSAALFLVAAAALARLFLDAERRQHLRTLLASVPIIEGVGRRGGG